MNLTDKQFKALQGSQYSQYLDLIETGDGKYSATVKPEHRDNLKDYIAETRPEVGKEPELPGDLGNQSTLGHGGSAEQQEVGIDESQINKPESSKSIAPTDEEVGIDESQLRKPEGPKPYPPRNVVRVNKNKLPQPKSVSDNDLDERTRDDADKARMTGTPEQQKEVGIVPNKLPTKTHTPSWVTEEDPVEVDIDESQLPKVDQNRQRIEDENRNKINRAKGLMYQGLAAAEPGEGYGDDMTGLMPQASRIVGAQSSMQDEGESSFNMHGDRNLSPSQQEMLDNLDAQADMLRQEQKNGRVGPQRYDEIERELEILRRKWFNLSIELQPKSWGSYPKYDLNIEKSQYGGWLPR